LKNDLLQWLDYENYISNEHNKYSKYYIWTLNIDIHNLGSQGGPIGRLVGGNLVSGWVLFHFGPPNIMIAFEATGLNFGLDGSFEKTIEKKLNYL
jgi:hypothetical protein